FPDSLDRTRHYSLETHHARLDENAKCCFLGQIRGKAVKDLGPALARAVNRLGECAFLGQRQIASGEKLLDIDGDASELLGILRHRESENQSARTIDLKVGTYALDFLSGASVD